MPARQVAVTMGLNTPESRLEEEEEEGAIPVEVGDWERTWKVKENVGYTKCHDGQEFWAAQKLLSNAAQETKRRKNGRNAFLSRDPAADLAGLCAPCMGHSWSSLFQKYFYQQISLFFLPSQQQQQVASYVRM